MSSSRYHLWLHFVGSLFVGMQNWEWSPAWNTSFSTEGISPGRRCRYWPSIIGMYLPYNTKNHDSDALVFLFHFCYFKSSLQRRDDYFGAFSVEAQALKISEVMPHKAESRAFSRLLWRPKDTMTSHVQRWEMLSKAFASSLLQGTKKWIILSIYAQVLHTLLEHDHFPCLISRS